MYSLVDTVIQITNMDILIKLAFVVIFVTGSSVIHPINAEDKCNICSNTTNIVCISKSEYRICENNTGSPNIFRCPNNFHCSSEMDDGICYSISSGVPPSCTSCRQCSIHSIFTCTSPNTFALCLETNVVSPNATGVCAPGLVCNEDLPELCGDPEDGILPSCPWSDINIYTTSVSLSEYAQGFCKAIQINKRFAIPYELDPNGQR
ncbi:uncharacterized protein LOC142232726 [Haematobia irritans]|uniref:uncharacterized protein LOC142232726 n=1 Tax=Haematobia irritans TaxID=7368 RepID=UPI003F5065BF